MKRILIFSTAYLPLVGGAEIAVKEITDRLPDFRFVMITAKLKSNLSNYEKIGNVEVCRIGTGSHWDKFRLIWEGHKKAKELGGFDGVWSIMASYAGFAALRYKKRNPHVPFLLTLQEGDSKWDIYKHVWWCWPYFKQIFKKADRIQAISNYLAKWAKDLGAKCPIEVVPNGVDLERFKIKDPRLKSKNIRFVITASRLVKKNGVEDLVRAMKFLPENIHLLVAGEGELENSLKQLVGGLHLNERVRFLGKLDHEQLSGHFESSEIFCRPSLSEGLGNAFLEAMAMGVPIIGTNVGGIPDFLQDGITGLACKVRNPDDIAKKISRILADEGLRRLLGENGRKLVHERYDWDFIAQKFGATYNPLIQNENIKM